MPSGILAIEAWALLETVLLVWLISINAQSFKRHFKFSGFWWIWSKIFIIYTGCFMLACVIAGASAMVIRDEIALYIFLGSYLCCAQAISRSQQRLDWHQRVLLFAYPLAASVVLAWIRSDSDSTLERSQPKRSC